MRAAIAPLALLVGGLVVQGQAQARIQAEAQAVLQCSGDQRSWVVAELLFGRSGVNQTRWTHFLANVVTPRFPDGLTVLDGQGQWRPAGGKRVTRERSTVVMIAMPPDAKNNRRLQEIRRLRS